LRRHAGVHVPLREWRANFEAGRSENGETLLDALEIIYCLAQADSDQR
jgi:hypothetical protein